MNINKFKVYLLTICFSAVIFTFADADTVVLTNNQRLKGVVVEDYNDRVVLSTMEGEKQIMRNKIRNVIYDLEEQNLANLGDFYQDRQMFKKAYYYYNKALEINPNYKKAREGLNYVGTYIQQKDRMRKISHIQRLNEERKWQQGITGEEEKTPEEKIKNQLGIIIKNVEESFKVADVVPGSPAAQAGILKGDIILEAWGRAVTYMQPKEVMEKLVSPGVMDIQFTIQRQVVLDLNNVSGNYSDMIGAKLGYSEMEGLEFQEIIKGGLADNAGIRVGDVLSMVQGQNTRYMPLKEVEKVIVSRKNDKLSLVINRSLVIWKKFINNKK